MASDPEARAVTLSYPGGAAVAARGLWKSLLGNSALESLESVTRTVSRGAHQRRRVIGGEATPVEESTYTTGGLPSTRVVAAAGGTPYQIRMGASNYTIRVYGSGRALGTWLKGRSWATPQEFLVVSPKGTKMGPFGG